MGVVFYGKASYNRAHRHRFTFQTVGFFDGRIHVVSAAHPAGELRALLFHEYVHAIYRERCVRAWKRGSGSPCVGSPRASRA
jgi:hypothetical protein